MTKPTLHRRDLLTSAAALGLASLAPSRAEALPAAVLGDCPTPSPSGVLGPFYAQVALDRADITEGLTGMPLQLLIRVLDRSGCGPISDAAVDIWHADPPGTYSGYASEGTAGLTFLRGFQRTNARGIARFQTIYPGWYPGRTAHVHARIYVAGAVALTTQLYFPQVVSDWVYANEPAYSSRGPAGTDNSMDGGFTAENLFSLERRPGGALAALTLTV